MDLGLQLLTRYLGQLCNSSGHCSGCYHNRNYCATLYCVSKCLLEGVISYRGALSFMTGFYTAHSRQGPCSLKQSQTPTFTNRFLPVSIERCHNSYRCVNNCAYTGFWGSCSTLRGTRVQNMVLKQLCYWKKEEFGFFLIVVSCY